MQQPRKQFQRSVDYLEAHITICFPNGIRREIARKVTDSWTKGTKQNYQQMFKHWCSFCHKRGLQVLEICVNNLVEYLDLLQETLLLCLHNSVYACQCHMQCTAACRVGKDLNGTSPQTTPQRSI